MKKSTKTFFVFVFVFYLLVILSSCTKQTIHQSPCNGNCDGNYEVIYQGIPISPNSNGYYEIDWNGLNYFQIEGNLTPLNDQYVINGVPLIEANFDSDYWVVFDTLRFQTPMYSYLGWFNDNTLNTPIPFGSYVYTINDLIDLHPPTNIAGYQIPKHFCTECPYAETILGSHSKYNYRPKQNFLVDDEMIGDTINIFIETVFNTEGGITYHGHNAPTPKEVINNQIKIIVI
jgi:hypothetical protein